MNTLTYRTISANSDTVNKEWLIIDAENQVLGRLSARIASILRGKHKTNFTPHVDCGDNVIVINADKVRLTGNKMTEKEYISHTGYPGGQRFTTPKKLMATHPERIIENAVYGMIPKNKLGAAVLRNLYVYAGSSHPHEAQKPKSITL